MTAMLSVSTIPCRSGLLTTTSDQDTWKTAQQIKTIIWIVSVRLLVLKLPLPTRTHFVDVQINQSLFTDLLSSDTFRYLFWLSILLVSSVNEWINKPTSFTAAVALSFLHSIGEQSSTLHSQPTVFLHKPVIFQQHPSGSSLDNECSSISRLSLTLSPRNLSYLPTSSQQCVLRARFTVHLTVSQMQSAQRSIVKLRETVGGLYPHRPLVEATREAVTLLCGTKRCSSARTHAVQLDARAFMTVWLGLR